ncbi:MAG TPA: 23S rRNA (guanosine(2251)-2'-O)-methyltransferase RlmB [Spongiibacteraceae bacterium]|nr:23S rRNA (guanosine(2251)-2'-O)-methyltransferase RlmB [Spongiibacteraceae bacterium]
MKNDFVYGIHSVAALLERSPERIDSLQVLEGRSDQRMQQLLQAAEEAQLRIVRVSRDALDKYEVKHQGVIALLAKNFEYREADLKQLIERADNPLLLILDGVTDPHNLGACLRSADAAGVDVVVAPKDNAASLTPVVRKVACGAAEAVPFVQVTNLARTLRDLQEWGVWIVGTAGEADTVIYDQDLKGPIAIAMGAEGSGLRRLTRERCDFLVKLPMAGSVSSLNVSVATGICLFEVVRQRRPQ